MPQYTLHRQRGDGMRAQLEITVFLADHNANAFAQVARELGITLKNGTLEEWRFRNAGAHSLFCNGIQIFPERTMSTIILTK